MRPPWPDAVRVHGSLRGIRRVTSDIYHVICVNGVGDTAVDFVTLAEYYIDSVRSIPIGWYPPRVGMTPGYNALTRCLDGAPIYNGVCFDDNRVFITSPYDIEWMVARPRSV